VESWRTQIPSVHSASELAARYKQLIKANHPDKVAQLDLEIQAFAEERSKRIITVYEEVVAGL
jgi:DnaJ-domain-containing protein 1